MNCKSGDLAIIVRGENGSAKRDIGLIVNCGKLYYPGVIPYWRLDPPILTNRGKLIGVADRDLRPIRDQPGDESFIVKVSPLHKEIA